MPDPNAPSNQITVDTLIDVIDTGDGLTSLREALAIATDNDEIIFETSLAGGTLLLNGSELVIDKSLTINGDTDSDSSTRNITIDGQENSRIFKIDDGDNGTTSDVSLLGLTLTGGFANNGSSDDDGGAIWNQEALTISDSTITGNTASDDGGGVRNDGILTINSSEINNNTSIGTSDTSGGGGLINTTGSDLTITATTLSGNTAQSGGGIRNDGNLTLKNSTLTTNSATSNYGGGALVNTFSLTGAAGTAQIINTTISGNTATVNGGGIAVAAGTVTLRNSTVIQNTAAATGGGISATGNVNLYNTILAGNTAATGADAHTDNIALFSLTGVINGDGNNLVGDVSGLGNGTLGSGTDLSLTTLGLTLNQVLRTTLASNGGPTQTHTLSAKSVAVDGGNNALALDESAAPLTSDQRGEAYERQIGTVDIGAVEYGSAGSTTSDILSGSQGNDYLFGDKGDDTLSGLGGNDRLRGGRGADALDGGEGTADGVDYRGSNQGVTVNLSDNTASGGDADGDTIINFERIYGSNFDDVLTGSDERNLLVGYKGNDTLFGLGGNDRLRGGEGADILDGGEGIADGVDYRGSSLGVTVNLSNNTASGGDAEGDTIINFERIYASSFDDVLTGSDERNLLVGYDGNDILSGLSGNDRLQGGQGADTLEGGIGRDTFEFVDLSDSLLVSYDTIVDLSIGLDKIKGVSTVAAGSISQLSAVGTLDESGIAAVLDTTSFVAEGAAVFTFGSGNTEQTFLALNDEVSGFQASNDSIIEITGFSGSVSDLAID